MSGAIWIDIALLAVLATIIIVYTVRGFAKSVIGFVVIIAALLVASLLGPMLGTLVYDGFMLEAVDGIMLTSMESIHDEVAGNIDGEAIISSLPEEIKHLLSFSGVDLGEIGKEITAIGESATGGLEHAAETVASPVAEYISNILSYLLIFIAAIIIFKLVAKLVVRVFELPVLRTLNKLAGFLMGLLIGFFACWGIAVALRLVFGMIALSNPLFLELADPSGTILYAFFAGIGF